MFNYYIIETKLWIEKSFSEKKEIVLEKTFRYWVFDYKAENF